MVDAAEELDRRVSAFESAWASGVPPELASFLPPVEDSQYVSTLAELIRVDLEFRRKRGLVARLDEYQSAFPALFGDATVVRELAFEEYRQRVAAGERTHPREYASRYGIDTTGWPQPSEHRSSMPTRVLHPEVDWQPPFPIPGQTVEGFRLLSELGRGSFGRVYLAEQTALSNRRVAVKFSTRFGLAEPETLARLQHTHIVPVYSSHRTGEFQIIVMPFLGALTVADLLAQARASGAPASGRALADTIVAGSSQPDSASSDSGRAARATPPDVATRTLAHFSYPEAVLWIGARLAEALAHAHDRGILHRDIKPANVLLTDEGQPMLLDFNLAVDAARPGPRVGGTPAYMAPEQLRLMRDEPVALDGRADVYALGVVLFEMLTGRHPFPPPAGASRDSATELLRLRSVSPPDLSALNPAVSPSAAAIVRKCLEPDPARRYASARQLADDLDRQLANRPLAHTREPSARERFRKWRRRHPRLASSGGVAILATILLLAISGAAVAGYQRAKRVEGEYAESRARASAAEQFRTFQADARDAVPAIVVYGHDPKRLEEGERRVRELLGRYGAISDADWASRPAVSLLTDADRLALRIQIAEMLMLLARVGADRAAELVPGTERDTGLHAALALVSRAEAAYGPDAVPRSVYADRLEIAARLGIPEATRLSDDQQKSAPPAAREAYLAGAALVARGRYADAIRLLEDATGRDPRQFWAWFNLGVARLGLGDDAGAEGCFNACLALEPDHAMSHFNRGLARLNRKQYTAAETDFTATLKLKPGLTDALVNRSLARLALGRVADAEADATEALKFGASETRLYFLRADIRAQRGNKKGAAADRAAGLEKEPTDELSWVARGLARADTDAKGALADFDAALKINARSFPALQNKAFVLAEKFHEPAEAAAVLDAAIELYPDSLPARAGRAVLQARKGDRAAAHRDAERCLGQNPGPDIVYQLAGVYALTSKAKPEDAAVSLRLLADALKRGYGYELLATDTDLDPLRGAAEFRKLAEAAKAVQSPVPKP